jgi:hypothetical protein
MIRKTPSLLLNYARTYMEIVGLTWGILEAISYFSEENTRKYIEPYWVYVIYVIPLLISFVSVLANNNGAPNKKPNRVKTSWFIGRIFNYAVLSLTLGLFIGLAIGFVIELATNFKWIWIYPSVIVTCTTLLIIITIGAINELSDNSRHTLIAPRDKISGGIIVGCIKYGCIGASIGAIFAALSLYAPLLNCFLPELARSQSATELCTKSTSTVNLLIYERASFWAQRGGIILAIFGSISGAINSYDPFKNTIINIAFSSTRMAIVFSIIGLAIASPISIFIALQNGNLIVVKTAVIYGAIALFIPGITGTLIIYYISQKDNDPLSPLGCIIASIVWCILGILIGGIFGLTRELTIFVLFMAVSGALIGLVEHIITKSSNPTI